MGSTFPESKSRYFIGLPLDPETTQRLASICSGIRIPGKAISQSDWHLTLRFLGSLSESSVRELFAELKRAPFPSAFSVQLSLLGGFPNLSRARILWLGLKNENESLKLLARLSENAAQRIGLPAEKRNFIPHITLSKFRVQTDISEFVSKMKERMNLELPIQWVHLYRSHLNTLNNCPNSSRYQIIDGVRL